MNSRPVDLMLGKLQGVVERNGGGWQALCPAHEDSEPSLSVDVGKGDRVLLHCHAGCGVEAILAKLGLTTAALFPNGPDPDRKRRELATYDYTDADGNLLHQVVRYEPKDFRQRRPDGNGGWIWNLKGIKTVLYNLPMITGCHPSAPVYICEGEKSVGALVRLGLPSATCNPMGAGAWRPHYGEYLKGRPVIILPDLDKPGIDHAQQVAQALHGVASSVRVLELPGLERKDTNGPDVCDWINQGGTDDELERLAQDAPEWRPAEAKPTGWIFRTPAHALTPRPPRQYIVEGILTLPGLSIMYGAPGTFKTMLALDLGICVAAGIPWLTPLPNVADVDAYITTQVPVMFLDFDSGERELEERIAALIRGHGLTAELAFYYISMPEPWLDANNEDNIALVTNHALALSAGLIIVDNLERVSGTADENSAQMGNVMGAFRRVSERTGAHTGVIHHQRKTTSGNVRAGETLRGHSSIEAALDMALLVMAEERSNTALIKSTKTRRADVSPLAACFTYEHFPGTKDLQSAKFFGIDPGAAVGNIAVMQAVRRLVRENPGILKTHLIDKVRAEMPQVATNQAREAIDALTRMGEIRWKPGERRAKHYHIDEE